MSNYSIAIETYNPFSKPIGTRMIRILIVADQKPMRKGLRMRLAAEADFVVLGEASDGDSAVIMATSLCPDVILLDIEMLHMDSLAMVSKIHVLCPNTQIITLSIHDDRQMREKALHAGASAFVGKSMPANTLLNTIREIIV